MLGKIMLALVVICAVSMGVYTFKQRDETPQTTEQANNAFMQIESGKRGDDPLYSEEIKKNTALTLQARDRAEGLAQQLAALQRDKAVSDRKTEQALARLDSVMQRLQTLNTTTTDGEINATVQAQLDDKIQAVNANIADLTHSLKTATADSQAQIAALQTALAQQRSAQESPQAPTPPPASVSTAEPVQPAPRPPRITYAYGQQAMAAVGQDNPSLLNTLTATFDKAGDFVTQGLDDSNTSNGQQTANQDVPTFKKPQKNDLKKEWETVFPVYTLPPNTVLAQSTLLTPIIGRVPLSTRNGSQSVSDPFFFKVAIGDDNLAANGHRIPGVAKMIASGYATGVREQSCVRGYIDSLTFIFVDGRIVTHGGQSQNGTSHQHALGYLADPWGKPCIRGSYINNAKDYLMSRGMASFIEAAATGLAQSQLSTQTQTDGNQQAILSGDVWSYVLGAGIGGSASELAEYVRDRSANAFDVVYVEQAQAVQIWLNDSIAIDYDSQARKVQYYPDPTPTAHYD